MLLLLILLHNAIASDYSEDANYTLKRISSCPDEGYFFQQAFGLNEVDPSLCYLCFCKTDGIAVCWRRSNSRCNRKSHRSEDWRDYRPRRSSVVTEIPQKNAPAKFYSQRSLYDCKPIGSSLSKGCPPDDWCLGCTLCDCDVSGRWSCHILSFCSDKKAPKQIENRNDTIKRRPVKIHPKSNVNTNTPKVHKYVKKLHTSHKCNKCLKSSSHEFSMAKQEFGLPRHDDTVVVIEKDLVGRTPMEVQGVRVKKVIHDNSSNIKLAHKIVQRAMAAVHKIINMNERNSTNVTKLFKVLQKRSMSLSDDYASHQSDYMSPHMYKKPSPRRFRKKISVNNIKIDNNSGRKKRVRRNIPYEGNATQGRIPRDFNNSLSETPLNEESTIRQLNKYKYVRYNVFTDRNSNIMKINKSDVDQTKIAVENLTNLSNSMDDQKNNTLLTYNFKNKTESNLNIKQTKSKLSRIFMRKSSFLEENEKRKPTDNEFITLIDVMLNRQEIPLFDWLKKPNFHKNISKTLNFYTSLKGLLNKTFTSSKGVGSLAKNNKLKLLRKQNFIDVFCNENMTCNVRPKDEIKLQMKINDLNGEMYKILETIKIINKILQKIELIEKHHQLNYEYTQLNFRNAVYVPKMTGINKRQMQLYYLKDSLNNFLISIDKFSYILYDILSILTGKDFSKKSVHRPLRCTKVNTMNNNNLKIAKVEQKFARLKTMLVNYNVLQNKFIKTIYDTLSKLESTLNNDEREKKIKISGRKVEKDVNNSISAVETYSKNIIENLRKLKNLAQKLSAAHRSKRSTMRDDDAIEYLLMLMEYLLKQNYPLDAAPVNDGIDLLIDAIKHAPDIKPIKKKVLHNPMTRVPVSRTTPRVTAETFSYVDNIYGIDSLEKGVNDTSHSDDNQVIFSPVIDGDDRIEDFHKLLQNSKKISNPFKLSNLNTDRDHSQLDFMTTTSTSIITTTPLIRYDFYKENTARPVEIETSLKTDKHSDVDEKDSGVENIKSDNNEAYRKAQSEIEEYSSNLIIVTEPDSFLITFPTRTEPVITTTTRKFHHMTKEKFEDPETMTYKRKNTKSKFGWIDYDQEENGSKLVQRKSAVRTTMATNTPKKQTDVNDISSITEEIMDETSKKHFSKMLPSSVFDKLNLMHSKEYGTKKSEIGSESKEIEQEDTYVNDIFPSYFT